MILRCIDFETLSLDPVDGVCEVAHCDVVEGADGWTVMPEQARFVDPGRPIPPAASAVHHILDEDVAGAFTWPEAAAWLLEGAPDVFVAQNARFEKSFFNPPGSHWICTYKVALHLAPGAPAHNLQTLRYWMRLAIDRERASPPHRAGPDTYVTAHLLKRMLVKLTVDQMLEITWKPAILPRFTFGKHAMLPIEDVPADYLTWVTSQEGMDPDVVATAHEHLARRKGLREPNGLRP